MKINGYWVATETEATDANGAHVSPRDWRRQESGMTLKVKRKKKNLKKKGRGGQEGGGVMFVSELRERQRKKRRKGVKGEEGEKREEKKRLKIKKKRGNSRRLGVWMLVRGN